MARQKKEDPPKGSAPWMNTFADLMNLLLCFFVLLFSMSTVDAEKFEMVIASLQSSFSILPSGGASIGDGQMISAGVSQLELLDEYYKKQANSTDTQESEENIKEAYEQEALDESEKMAEQVEQKKKNVFQMTYQVGDIRYLMKGYGEQLTGGYSIQVEEVSESENAVFCKTRLIGPEKADAGSEPSYPCIVLKIRETEKPIEFLGFIIK